MAAGTVTAFNAAQFKIVRTFVRIVGHIAEPPGATRLSPTFAIGIGRPCRNLRAVFQRDRRHACMGHGEPSGAFVVFPWLTHGDLHSPGVFTVTFHQRLALNIPLRCLGLVLASRQEQQTGQHEKDGSRPAHVEKRYTSQSTASPLASFGVHGPHFGVAAAFEGFVLFVEFLEDGGETFDGFFLSECSDEQLEGLTDR